MSTLTKTQQQAIADFLKDCHIQAGLGSETEACSIAAINLALTGQLTDKIPECMSPVIGFWIIGVQDSMPDSMRNSTEWRRLLPLAAGTGRNYEQERLALILDWMWGTVLPTVQPVADKYGFGAAWKDMCTTRTSDAAARAARAADAAGNLPAADAAEAADAAGNLPTVYATRAAVYAARAARAARELAAHAADAADDAYATRAAWEAFNPCDLLARLIAVTEADA